jgi:hypothetical protein
VGKDPLDPAKKLYGRMPYELSSPVPLTEKMQFAAMMGAGSTPVVNVSSEDVARLREMNMLAKKRAFDTWVGAHYAPYDNPASRELLKKIYPEWFESMKQAVDEYHRFHGKIESLKIMGATNKEELYLLWQLQENERLKARMDDKTNPGLHTEDDLEAIEKSWRRGVFARHNPPISDVKRMATYGLTTEVDPDKDWPWKGQKLKIVP